MSDRPGPATPAPSPINGVMHREPSPRDATADPGPSAAPGSFPPETSEFMRLLKGLGHGFGLALALVPAVTCWLESRLTGRSDLFQFWGQSFALLPGLPGKYLRRCFYRLTLQACSLTCDIGFLSSFNDRRTEVGDRVYVGFGASLGLVSLGDGCLIGNRTAVLNGGQQHQLGPDGRLTPFDHATATRVRIGEETWIGEGAILMADVGRRSIVAAGSVVSGPVPAGCLVGGNPARFVRKLVDDRTGPQSSQEGRP